jgi:multiple sugar transport system substrate-binding protein
MRKLVITIILLSVGCSPNGENTNTLNFWQFWSDTNTKPIVEQLVREFEAENPGIDVRITDLTWANGHEKLVISFAAKQPPDVMELGSDWIAEFAANGLLAQMESSIEPNYLYPAKWENRIYGVPWMLDTRILYFNVDLLKKAGVGVPQTWAELAEACSSVSQLGADYFGFGCNSAERHRLYKKFLPFLWSNGGQVMNGDGASALLDSPQAVEALEFYLDLCECGLIESQRRLEEYFREGKIGFVVSGGWLLRRLKLNPPPFEYKLIGFFSPKGGIGTSFFGGEYLSIYAATEKLEASKKLVAFMTRKENSQRLCDAAGFGFPPYRETEESDPNVQAEMRQLQNSISNPPTPLWVDIEQDIEDAIEAGIFKHGSAAEVLKTANNDINAKLESYHHAKTD